jgi:hypothetical protein
MGKPFKESVDEAVWSSTATDYYAEVSRHEAGRVVGPVIGGQFISGRTLKKWILSSLPRNLWCRLHREFGSTPLGQDHAIYESNTEPHQPHCLGDRAHARQDGQHDEDSGYRRRQMRCPFP